MNRLVRANPPKHQTTRVRSVFRVGLDDFANQNRGVNLLQLQLVVFGLFVCMTCAKRALGADRSDQIQYIHMHRHSFDRQNHLYNIVRNSDFCCISGCIGLN